MKKSIYQRPMSLPDLDKKLMEMIKAEHFQEAVHLIINPRRPVQWGMIVDVAIKNPTINDFFETNTELNEFWAQCLSEKKHINYSIPTTNGKTVSSVFERFKGVWFWAQYRQAEDKESAYALSLLDKACNSGIYNAMILQTNNLRARLVETQDDETLKKLFQFLQTFCDKWWSIGYLNTALILIDVADHFKGRDNLESMGKCLEAAIEAFYLGFYLMENSVSQKIMDSLYPDEGWITLFDNYSDGFKIENAKDLERKIVGALTHNFEITAPEIFIPRLAASAAEKARVINANYSDESALEYKPEYKLI